MGIKFSGINIHAKDPVTSFAFYKGLGLTVKTEAPLDDEWYGAEFDLGGGALLWIWRDHTGCEEASKRLPIQIVLHCEEIEETYRLLKSTGYEVTAPERMFYGGKEMNLTDPDGNSLLFLD